MGSKVRRSAQTSSRWLKERAPHHAGEILKLKKQSTPYAWMLISGLSALAPLIVGEMRGEIGLSIFGGLTGYLIGLCDHRGTLGHRIAMATVTAILCWVGFAAGIALQSSLYTFMLVTSVNVFLIGSLAGKGGELERALVFCGIDLFVSRYAPSLTFTLLPTLSLYFFAAYAMAVVGILISRFTLQKSHQDFVHLKTAFQKLIVVRQVDHFYTASYILSMLFSIVYVEKYEVVRGYWLLVTVLLLMKPNSTENVYRVFQRAFGTLTGVLMGHFIISLQPPLYVLCGGVFLFSALVPFVWYRNYWLVAFCATNLVICLLSIAQFGHVDPTLTATRFKVTVIACIIGLAAVLIFRGVERFVILLRQRMSQ